MNTEDLRSQASAGGQEPDEQLALANQLYCEFYAQCFWHSPRDLVITKELVPFVVKGLRHHGGRRGFLLAETLRPKDTRAESGEQGAIECR
jgi:hypothetical protein